MVCHFVSVGGVSEFFPGGAGGILSSSSGGIFWPKFSEGIFKIYPSQEGI